MNHLSSYPPTAGATIRHLRRILGISQSKLAKKIGLRNKSSVSLYEAGVALPSPTVACKIVELAQKHSICIDYKWLFTR